MAKSLLLSGDADPTLVNFDGGAHSLLAGAGLVNLVAEEADLVASADLGITMTVTIEAFSIQPPTLSLGLTMSAAFTNIQLSRQPVVVVLT